MLVGWFRRLGLLWKLLLPLVGMTLAVGMLGAFLTVRHLTARAEVDLDQDLFRRSTIAEATLRDHGLRLAESVRFGANLEGAPEAVAGGDVARVRELLASVPAARPSLDLVVVADRDGVGIVEVTRAADGFRIGAGRQWGDLPGAPAPASSAPPAGPGAALVRVDEGPVLAVAGPIQVDGQVVGTLIAGIDARAAARSAADRAGVAVDIYEPSGRLFAASGERRAGEPPPPVAEGSRVRRTERLDGEEVAVLYGPLDVVRDQVGLVAVRLPVAPAFAAARGAALRVAALVVMAMAGIVGLGALIARMILRQVRPLVTTNRALGRGELSARAPVLGDDELGELARGLNLMAEQLQAGHEELELRVAVRTEELARVYRDALHAEQGRSELFAELVHELRNQVLVIAGYADLMADPSFDPGPPDWRLRYGTAIAGATDELRGRIDEVLDLAKAEAGKMDFDLEAVSVADVMAEMSTTVVALARRGDLGAEIQVPDDLPRVRADRRRLGQILMNLVSNAVKYTPPGGRIRIFARAVRDRVEVAVEDTGIGIPEEAGEQVFQPFYRVSATAAAQGGFASTGLGLAVTRRLVQGQGGRIWYASRPGQGTTFAFTLPIERRVRRRAATRRFTAARRRNAHPVKEGVQA